MSSSTSVIDDSTPSTSQSCEEIPFQVGLDGTRDIPALERTSLRSASKISRGLLAKVSRFEALDALGVPLTVDHPQLPPSPLQSHRISRQSSFLKTHTDIVERTNFPAVSSSNTRYKDNEQESKIMTILEISQENGAHDGLDAAALQSTVENIKHQIEDTTIEVCYKPTSIRLREGEQSHKISPSKGALMGNLSLSRMHTPRRGLDAINSANTFGNRSISRVSGLIGASPQKKAYAVYRDTLDSFGDVSNIIIANTYDNINEHQNDIHAPRTDSMTDTVTMVSRSITPIDHNIPYKGSPIAKYTVNKIGNGTRRSQRHSVRSLSPHAKSLGTFKGLVTRYAGFHDKQPQRVQAKVETVVREITSSPLRKVSITRNMLPEGETAGTDTTYSPMRKVSSIRSVVREGEPSVTSTTTTTLKDKIALFDGAVSRVASTVARPSIASAASSPTTIHRPSTVNRQVKTPSAAGTVRRLSEAVNPALTPTRTFRAISQSPAHQKQNLVFGSPIKNPFESPASTNKSSIPSISPTTRRVSSLPRQSPAGSLTSQSSPQRGARDFRSGMTQIREASGETSRKSSWWETAKFRDDTVSSLSKRKISHAESIKRHQETTKEEPKLASDALPSNKNNDPIFGHGVVANMRRSLESQRSKVADMKRMFDGNSSARPSVVPATDKVPQQITNPPEIKMTPRKTRESASKNTSPSHQASPTRLLVFPPRYSTSAKAKPISLKTVDPSPKHSVTSKIETKESPKRTVPPVTSRPQAKSKTIGERMKLFEKSNEVKPEAPESKRRALGRKINRSLKGLFELHSPGKHSPEKSENSIAKSRGKYASLSGKETKYSTKDKDKNKGSLSGRDVKSVMEEFMDFMPVSPTRKAGTAGKGGRWLGSRWLGQDDAQSMELIPVDSTEASEHEMIVKEVECGLKHPRPMRGTEMNRMMALCREKVGMGSMRFKEKEKAAKVGAKPVG